jgi:hypothetical protein
MPSGGVRQGAGRKPGSKNKRNVALSDAIKSQLTSLPKGFEEPLALLLKIANRPEPKVEDFDDAAAYARALSDHRSLILDAAKAAAPYRHARLSASETGKPNEEEQVEEMERAAKLRLASLEGKAVNDVAA